MQLTRKLRSVTAGHVRSTQIWRTSSSQIKTQHLGEVGATIHSLQALVSSPWLPRRPGAPDEGRARAPDCGVNHRLCAASADEILIRFALTSRVPLRLLPSHLISISRHHSCLLLPQPGRLPLTLRRTARWSTTTSLWQVPLCGSRTLPRSEPHLRRACYLVRT